MRFLVRVGANPPADRQRSQEVTGLTLRFANRFAFNHTALPNEGSVATLQEWSDMLRQCSLRQRFPVCSSGGNSNQKSSFLAVGWYLRFSLSYRDVEELLAERGLHADHVTVWRWVQRYAPEMERRLRSRLRPTNDSWRVDETYIRVKGKWVYLYAFSFLF